MKSMNLLSRCHLGTPAPPRSAGGSRGEADHISALADDLLILILVRLGCAAAAARAGLLSRRWRDLWTRLPALFFRDVGLPSLEMALSCVISSASSDAVSLLDIRLSKRAFSTGPGECQLRGLSSLLRTAARLSPEQLVLALPAPLHSSVALPCCTRATSISISVASHIILQPPSDELHMLTTLVLTRCAVHELAALVLRCPHLRVLRFVGPVSSFIIGHPTDIVVHSASLRELVLNEINRARSIDIAAPMLEQLTVSARPYGNLSISVTAPKLEKVSWRRHYGGIPLRFGCWTLEAMSFLSTVATAAQRRRSLTLLRADVSTDLIPESLSLGEKDYLAREVEKHLQVQVADSSVLDLELHLEASGLVYEAFVFFFLEIHPIRTSIHRLKVTLSKPKTTPHTDKRGSNRYCGCVPQNWTSQTISLTELGEVEIDGFQGADHEFDFLKHLFTCSPMLKRVTLKQSSEATPSGTKLHEFFVAHPRVECYHVLSSDSAFVAPR